MTARPLPRSTQAAIVATGALAALVLASPASRADESIIRSPGDHAHYIFEAEPHLLIGYGEPFDNGGNVGLGFRGTFHIANGFVRSINDSVGVGFGFDFAPGSGHVLVPIVMQWNFWLSTRWSVFFEPGVAFGSGDRNVFLPSIYAGGRLHFTDRIALTIRLGYPNASFGVSFLL